MANIIRKLYNRLAYRKKSFPMSNVKQFCEIHSEKYMKLKGEIEFDEMQGTIWLKDVVIKNEIIKRKFPESYVAEIDNAVVFGENEWIVSDGMLLCDMFTCEYCREMNFNKGIIQNVSMDEGKAKIAYRISYPYNVGKAIFLLGNFSFNYFHFLVNIMPKWYYLNQINEYKDYAIVVDEKAYGLYKEIIDIFNIYNRKILCLKPNFAYKADKLVYASNCCWYDRYIKYSFGYSMDKEAIVFVRKSVLEKIQGRKKIDKVYVSRTKLPSERQRLINEEEIERLFNQYGFVSVYPENMTFKEQVELFSQVKFLAGSVGAAFTNIIFMPSNSTIICGKCIFDENEMFSFDNVYSCLWHIVGDGRFIFLKGEETKESKNMVEKHTLKKYRIDVHYAEELLRTLH